MRDLYPRIKPYNRGLLPVGNGHSIYWEECGNPNGFPIFFLHGGPGAGCDEDDRRFFNPDKWRIIIHDQRGCGRSKADNKLKANNTWTLVDDVHELRRKLNIDKFVVFGGSWGSTLATAYSIMYPKTVAGMVLRGIYLGTKEEADYFYKDGYDGVGIYLPKQWKRYISHVPPECRHDPLSYYLQEIENGNEQLSHELALYECANLHLVPQSQEELEKDLASSPEIALLEAHYLSKNCFMEDGWILNNAHEQLEKIPVSIIHGRYDLICMPLSAYRLHKALPSSTINWTVAGHSSRDPETLEKLISETEAMFEKVSV